MTNLNKLPDNSFELTLTIPWAQVKPVYDVVIDKFIAEVEIEGFRKGKAPRDLALKKIDPGNVFGETINDLLPKIYSEAIKEHNLTPIINPKVQIISTKENEDWVFKAISCEKPQVALNNSIEEIKTINSKNKIWTPEMGENSTKTSDQQDQDKNKKVSEIISKLLEVSKVDLPAILIEQETSRLLTQLVDDVRAAGLTLDQYLAGKGLNSQTVQKQYETQAEATLKLEFILEEIAKAQNISVEKSEIDAIINRETEEKAKEALQSQSYVLAAILRREKTLTYLTSL